MKVYPPGTWTLREIQMTLDRFASDKSEVEPAINTLLTEGRAYISTRYGITILENGVTFEGEQLFEVSTHARAPMLMADATDDGQ